MTNQIVEVFGKFAIEVDGEIQNFETRRAAELTLAAHLNGEAHRELADGYIEARGFEGKVAVGKGNVVIDFLAYQDVIAMESDDDEDD